MPSAASETVNPHPEAEDAPALARLEQRFWMALRSRLRREQNPHEWYVCWLLTVTELLEGTLELTRLNQRLMRRQLRRLQPPVPEGSSSPPAQCRRTGREARADERPVSQ